MIFVKPAVIHDAKTNLSRSLAERKTLEPRIGVAKGEFTVPDSFFEALPEDVLAAFIER